MKLSTERLILRPWEKKDAESLYKHAKNPDVGPIAGWPPHKNIDESREVIKNVFSGEECYAVCLKTDNIAIGCIELKVGYDSVLTKKDDECELGYWLGQEFWGRGIIPEAARELIRRGFEDLNMSHIWCAYYDGNIKSKRVQKKLGFTYYKTYDSVPVPLMGEERRGHINYMTRKEWQKKWEKCK